MQEENSRFTSRFEAEVTERLEEHSLLIGKRRSRAALRNEEYHSSDNFKRQKEESQVFKESQLDVSNRQMGMTDWRLKKITAGDREVK